MCARDQFIYNIAKLTTIFFKKIKVKFKYSTFYFILFSQKVKVGGVNL